jgi:hypothetical protein
MMMMRSLSVRSVCVFVFVYRAKEREREKARRISSERFLGQNRRQQHARGEKFPPGSGAFARARMRISIFWMFIEVLSPHFFLHFFVFVHALFPSWTFLFDCVA